MRYFVTLARYTQQGMSTINRKPLATRCSLASCRKARRKDSRLVFDMGHYDAVLIPEVPSDEACAKFTLTSGALGNISLRLPQGIS